MFSKIMLDKHHVLLFWIFNYSLFIWLVSTTIFPGVMNPELISGEATNNRTLHGSCKTTLARPQVYHDITRPYHQRFTVDPVLYQHTTQPAMYFAHYNHLQIYQPNPVPNNLVNTSSNLLTNGEHLNYSIQNSVSTNLLPSHRQFGSGSPNEAITSYAQSNIPLNYNSCQGKYINTSSENEALAEQKPHLINLDNSRSSQGQECKRSGDATFTNREAFSIMQRWSE